MIKKKQPKVEWYTLKDKTFILKVGRYKVLEIYKRPHKGYCCVVYDRSVAITSEGYHGTSLPQKHFAVRWGCKKARELNLMP